MESNRAKLISLWQFIKKLKKIEIIMVYHQKYKITIEMASTVASGGLLLFHFDIFNFLKNK